ncbi:hypothetical protein MAH1_21190 [Sessilibacter sp. MAH1]
MRELRLGLPEFYLLIFLFALISPAVFAQTEEVIEYRYDGSGNIIEVFTQGQSGAPVIDTLSPFFVNLGDSVFVSATGENLLSVSVETETLGVSISNVDSDFDRLSFLISANTLAEIGQITLTISNKLGAITSEFTVAGRAPEVRVSPSPIVLLPNSTPKNFQFSFSEQRPASEIFSVDIDDSNVAFSSVQDFSLASDSQLIDIPIAGQSTGNTSLFIESTENLFSFSFPIFVSQSFADYLSQFEVDSPEFRDLTTDNILSRPVGVNLSIMNEVLGPQVGVNLGPTNSVLGLQVGVLGSDFNNFFGPSLEIILGSLLNDTADITLPRGQQSTFVITGVGLQDIADITFSPATGITLDGFSVGSQGRELTITVTIAANIGRAQSSINLQSFTGINALSRNGLAPTLIFQ